MLDRTFEDRIRMFRELMPRPVAENFEEWLLHEGFFHAPASTQYHGSYEGGLFDHSYEVTKALIHLTTVCGLRWHRAVSPYIVGMFHDLCKVDCYRHPIAEDPCAIDTRTWEHRKDMTLRGHGDKSVMLLAMHTTLTEEEVMCIRYHMGAFTEKEEWRYYTTAVKNFPNVLWTHTADMLASQVLGI